MECNNGDARVDIDLNERRNFQLVLTKKSAFSTFDATGWNYEQIKSENERIYRGWAIDGMGVFDSKKFVGFFASDALGSDEGRFGFKVKRATKTSKNSETLTFTAVNLGKCAGHIRSNDFPDDCTIGNHEWKTCKMFD